MNENNTSTVLATDGQTYTAAVEGQTNTVREEILSRIRMEGEQAIPIREDEELQKEKTILDQEYKAFEKGSEYKRASLADIASRDDGAEDEEDGPNQGLVKHTDAYLFKGKEYPVVVCKVSTEVLDSLNTGKYMAISFFANFSRMDSESLETTLKDFQPSHIDLPRKRISNNINEDGLIVVEPSINGFKISCFMEDLDPDTYKSIDELNQWIEDYQGYLLEETMKLLHEKGVDIDDLLKSQICVGLIPRTRQKYESRKAIENGDSVITKDIREKSRAVAEALNAQLELMPLTNQIVEFGCSVYTLEVTQKNATQMGWTSSRKNISYFTKGSVNGRIVRITGSKRKIPLVSEKTAEVKDVLEQLAPVVVTVFENCARAQLGLPKLPVPNYPDKKKCEKKNVAELFEIGAEKCRQIEDDYTQKANDFLNKYFKSEETRDICSLLGKLRSSDSEGIISTKEDTES